MATLGYVRLLWTTLLGFLVFDQLPGLPTWVGATIVIVATILTIYRDTRHKSGLAIVTRENVGD